ncbi:MAG TPA: class I SAM-dependent methyltransferase [Acidimicrobiia bacterium]
MTDPRSSDEAPNAAERRRWNHDYWTSIWPKREALTDSVTDVLLEHASLLPGMHLLEIGSGGGKTAIAAGRLVAPDGDVVGADLSVQLTELATQRAKEAGAANVRYSVADMQYETLDDRPFDAAISQFGVMFFDEPVTAFTNIAKHVVRNGALTFACWQPFDVNPWHPGEATAAFLPPVPAPAPGKSPTGPFALADAGATASMLEAAGWSDVACTLYDRHVVVARDAFVDDGQLAFMGISEPQLPEALARLDAHTRQFEVGDGRYELPIAFQIFTATRA